MLSEIISRMTSRDHDATSDAGASLAPFLRALRLRLAAWYIGILLCILIIVGTVAVLAVQHSLAVETDRSLKIAAEAQTEHTESLIVAGRTPTGRTSLTDGDEAYAPMSGDIFVFFVDAQGHLTANPRNVREPGLPVSSGIGAALRGQRDLRTVVLGKTAFRVLSLPLEHGGAVQVGKSFAPELQEIRDIELVLGAISVAGLVLVGLGGTFMAERAMAPIKEGFARQRAFVADASHELRAPLTLIRADAETLLRGAPRRYEADTALVEDIVKETDRLSRMISDLLFLAQMDEGQVEFAEEVVELQAAVRDAAQRATPLLAGRTIHLSAPVHESLMIAADAGRLAQLLLILLDNAIRHTPPATSIDLRTQKSGRYAEVILSDNGPGMSAEAMRHAFDRFYRGNRDRPSPLGAGLGLSIARAVAQSFHGTLELTSATRGGLRVTLRLPLLQNLPDTDGILADGSTKRP